MKKIVCLMTMTLMGVVAFAQTVTLTFTGRDAADHWIQLNRVVITNLTKSWQETIYWPDTTLTMQNGTGIDESVANGSFALSQNNPNPFTGTTDVNLTVADAGAVTLEILDGNGKTVGTHRVRPEIGTHQFRVSLSAAGTYVMTARQNGKTSSIKMVCNGAGNGNGIDYLGMVQTITFVLKSTTNNPFNFGDMMEYVGYATINGTEMESQHITQAQGTSQTFVLQFDAIQLYVPVVSTDTVGDVTTTSATCGGNVTNDGGAAVNARGICWSTSHNPTTSGNHTTDGSGTGSFTSTLTGLIIGTTYYVRAYATNSVGTAYGEERSFTTLCDLPEVTTTQPVDVTTNSFTCGGDVIAINCDELTARGVCWNTTGNPTIADNHTTDGTAAGSFTSSVTELIAGTIYYVRAYATNSMGTAYGEELSVTIPTLPTVTTTSITNITNITATSGGNVTSDGGSPVTARGVCWSTGHNPTIGSYHTTDGNGTDSFTSSLSILTPNTTYYVRAYATNSVGTAYGEEVDFTTTVFTCGTSLLGDADGNIYNTVQIGGQCWMKENLRTKDAFIYNISYGGSSNYSNTTAYWYYPNHDISNMSTYGLLYNWPAVMLNSSTSSANPSGRQGICPTGWHVPSDAEWTQLTDCVGSQIQYVCDSISTSIGKALADTMGWSSTTNTCAVGNTPTDNNATGFSALPAGGCYGSSEGLGDAAYFWSATASSSNVAYYRQLRHLNSGVYRNDKFKWCGLSVRCVRDEDGGRVPTVTTTSVTNITATTATSGGNVTSNGGATITARGVCWSTTSNPTIIYDHTTDGNGTSSFTSSLTNLTPNTTYYVRAYATNSVGIAYGSEVSFTTNVQDGDPCPGTPTLTDASGNTYNTVWIGTQCWMKENLRTKKYANGTTISQGSSTSSTVAYWYYPNNSSSNTSTYGLLYNWKAVMGSSSSSSYNPSGVQGICPTGWHMPSDAEWTQLTDYVSSQNQYVCGSTNTQIAKALAGTIGWNSSTTTCAVGNTPGDNNATGFSALPAGTYFDSYNSFGNSAYFWSTTGGSSSNAYSYYLRYDNARMSRYSSLKMTGYSVRCVKD